MIDLLLQAGLAFLSFIIGLFPISTGFPTEVHTAFSSLGQYLYMFDQIVPLETLFWCLSLLVTVELAIFGFKTIKWLASHIPFIGGRG